MCCPLAGALKAGVHSGPRWQDDPVKDAAVQRLRALESSFLASWDGSEILKNCGCIFKTTCTSRWFYSTSRGTNRAGGTPAWSCNLWADTNVEQLKPVLSKPCILSQRCVLCTDTRQDIEIAQEKGLIPTLSDMSRLAPQAHGSWIGVLTVWSLLSHPSGNGLFNCNFKCCHWCFCTFYWRELNQNTSNNDLSVLLEWLWFYGLMCYGFMAREWTDVIQTLCIPWWVTGCCWGRVESFLQREIKANANSCVLFSPRSDTGCQLGLFHLEQRRRCEAGSHVSQPAGNPVSPGKDGLGNRTQPG